MSDRETTLVDGSPVTPDHKEIDPVTGMQRGYVVLSEADRAKGFVRPVRRSYVHVGAPGPAYELRGLTAEEAEFYAAAGYARFEKYPESELPTTGRFWTQEQLDTAGKGCGAVTTMALPLAETFARDPQFYGGAFCATCRAHFPVGEFTWDGAAERVGS